jgi:hypothetical protein
MKPSQRTPLAGPDVWTGAEMAGSSRWIRTLGPAQIADLDAALPALRGRPWTEIGRGDLPLPAWGALLEDIARELEHGCGIVKLRGFPVDRLEEDDLRRLFFGLGAHLGTPLFQNRDGETMRAIRDEGAAAGRRYGETTDAAGGRFLSSYARTLTNGALRFHTDRADAVALLCVRQALTGGVSRLVSTPAIHNALLERRPDLLEELFGPFWRSRFGEEAATRDSVYPLPIFGVEKGRFTSHFSLTFIEAAQLASGVPPLTDRQREAIDALMAVAEELSFAMTLEPGDLQLINSHVTYHGRTAFADDPAGGRDRLLLRLWLAMPDSRPLPPDHAVLWGSVAAGRRRGGIARAMD